MKRCQKCSYENADSMSFCLEGAPPLPGAPMILNLKGSSRGGAPDTAFNRSAENGGQFAVAATMTSIPKAKR